MKLAANAIDRFSGNAYRKYEAKVRSFLSRGSESPRLEAEEISFLDLSRSLTYAAFTLDSKSGTFLIMASVFECAAEADKMTNLDKAESLF